MSTQASPAARPDDIEPRSFEEGTYFALRIGGRPTREPSPLPTPIRGLHERHVWRRTAPLSLRSPVDAAGQTLPSCTPFSGARADGGSAATATDGWGARERAEWPSWTTPCR